MVSQNSTRQVLVVTALLGVAALITNVSVDAVIPAPLVRIGNIFLAIAAISYGVLGALISLTFGVFTELVLSPAPINSECFVRTLVLFVAIGYTSQRFPRLPPFGVALAAWSLLFGPFSIILTKVVSNLHNVVTLSTTIMTALGDIFLVLAAGALLLNQNIWNFIARRPRQITVNALLTHVLAMVSTLVLLVSFSVTHPDTDFFTPSSSAGELSGFLALLMVSVVAPALLGWRLAVLMTEHSQEFFRAAFMAAAQGRSFSGLSTEYWRRQTSSQTQDPLRSTIGGGSPTSPGITSTLQRSGLTPDKGIISLRRDGTITYVNRKFRKYAEISDPELIGKKIADVIMNAQLKSHIVEIALSAAAGATSKRIEAKINELPDKLRFFELATYSSEQIKNSSIAGDPTSVAVTIEEITDRRTVEAKLLEGQRIGSLGNFITGMAHAFNNVLTTISGQASFAQQTSDPATVEQALREILSATQGAGTLLHQLLDFASGKPGSAQILDMGKFLEERLDLLRKIVGTTCELRFEAATSPIFTSCEGHLLTQALTNLILNARNSYGPNGGTIELSLQTEVVEEEVANMHRGARPGSFARIRIRDTGRGKSQDWLARAFDPTVTTKVALNSNEISLSVVYAIIKAHDGFLTAETHPERGTSVSLYLPLALALPSQRSAALSTTSETPDRTRLRGNREEILVVEDDEAVRKLVTTMLTSLGYRVTSCSNGEEALDHVKRSSFQLILVDLVIPKMQGRDLINRVKETNPEVKALLMTGYSNDTPGSVILPKPFDMDTLAGMIKNTLAEKHG